MRYSILVALLLALLPCCAIAAPEETTFNVVKFGAKGDGMTDDTAAFQKALDTAGAKGGGTVHVPAGNYLIKTNISVPINVTLEGVWKIPHVAVKLKSPYPKFDKTWLAGSVLLAVDGAGKPDGTAFIRVSTNSTLKGLTVYYPDQKIDGEPTPYPWTIASVGCDNPSIIDCLLVNPYQAVDFGTNAAGRHYIRNLYGQPLYKGLFIDNCLDVGRIENVHFWPFWTCHVLSSKAKKTDEWVRKNGTAFIFARSDWEYVNNCFAISYHIGLRFMSASDAGPGNYLLSQTGGDCCDVAVQVDESQGHSGVSFSNSQIFGRIVVNDTNPGPVRFTGCGIFGASGSIKEADMIQVAGRGRVSFDNCHLFAISNSPQVSSFINVTNGRLGVNNCVFMNNKHTAQNIDPIVLGENTLSAIITGNEFFGSKPIVNKATDQKSVVIADNVFGTDEK